MLETAKTVEGEVSKDCSRIRKVRVTYAISGAVPVDAAAGEDRVDFD